MYIGDINIKKFKLILNIILMAKLDNDIILILKAYLKCDEISCNNYGINRIHYDGIYCSKCYHKILNKYCNSNNPKSNMIWGYKIGGIGGNKNDIVFLI
jgi:hypothetical protein